MRKEEKERSEGIYNIQGAREREGESEKHAWLMVKKNTIYTQIPTTPFIQYKELNIPYLGKLGVHLRNEI